MHSSKQVLQSCSSRCLLAKMLGDSILDIESSPEHFDHMSKISHERKIQDETEALNLLGLKNGDYSTLVKAASPVAQIVESGNDVALLSAFSDVVSSALERSAAVVEDAPFSCSSVKSASEIASKPPFFPPSVC